MTVRQVERARPAVPAAQTQLEDRLFVACGLAWSASLIHVVAAFQHVSEYALSAVFFALLAPAQFAWGIALYRSRARGILHVGLAMCLGVVALWITSRTVGLPIGPEPWKPEAVGALDTIATADEIVLALIAALELKRARHAFDGALRRLAPAAGTVLVLLSSIALVAGGHAH